MNLALNIAVFVATVLGSGMALPQARRLVRTRRVDGVSSTWIGVSIALNGWWLAYGLVAGVWALVPVSTISLVLYATMGVAYLATVGRSSLPGFAVGMFVLGMIPLPFLALAGWSVAGVVVGLCYGVQLLPAVVSAFRSSSLAGVSALTWLIACIESLIWFAYGMAVADAALVLAGAVGTVMSSLILVRLSTTGHRPFDLLDARRGGPVVVRH